MLFLASNALRYVSHRRNNLSSAHLVERRHVVSSFIPSQHVLQRICVRPPYFALEDLSLEGERLTAYTRAETPIELEPAPMSAAELGRHAAISGLSLVALLQKDDDRRYYLAQRAECDYFKSEAPFGSRVKFEAKLLEMDKRAARVTVEASLEDQAIAQFTISYSILTERTFERLFARYQKPTYPTPSPYAKPLSETYERGELWAETKVTIPAWACVGHFDGYPALPVAMLMSQLSYLAGQIMGQPYFVPKGLVEANDLCWADKEVTFRADLVAIEGITARFSCTASLEGRIVGEMSVWLEPILRTEIAAHLHQEQSFSLEN
jgi:3-hydroxymyristoyl/3-hydroxydecanoyl-(acyl carrier protein) dehydratase